MPCRFTNPSTARWRETSARTASPTRRSTPRSSAPSARSTGLRARHADGGLPLLRLPETHDDLPAIRDAGQRLADNATDIVFLGTGGSSLGGQTLAQLAGHGVPGVGALARAAAPAFHGQSRCRHLRHAARQAAASNDALRRHLEIRRHRRDADADHRRAVGGEGRGARNAHPRYFPRPHRAGQARQAQRPARSARRTSRADARS